MPCPSKFSMIINIPLVIFVKRLSNEMSDKVAVIKKVQMGGPPAYPDIVPISAAL